ncbi:MAG: hypothetical protein Q8K60_07950 [Parachlamydiaceae bacterium]|nr:hypothetical protein [Parachlamydiaceae bacterium]
MSNVEKIFLNFNDYPEYSSNIDRIKNENKIDSLIKNIQFELNKCKINKSYTKVRNTIEGKNFEIIAKIGDQEQLILAGNWKNFHHSLIDEVALKFFYNISLDISITPEAFDFIRRIPIHEWKEIAQLIKKSPPLLEEQIQAFKIGQYDHPVFQEKEWPALALKAYFEQKIDRNQITTLLLYDGIKQLEPAKLKNNREIPVKLEVCYLFDKNNIIDSKVFINLLNNLDFYIVNLEFSAQEQKELITALSSKNQFENPHFFIYSKFPASPQILLPPNLINILLKIKSKHAIRFNPVLGHSLRDDFTHKTYRDALVFCRYIKTPDTLHGTKDVNPLFFYSHDLIHVIFESFNIHRSFWLELAAKLELHHLTVALNTILDRNFNPDTSIKDNIKNLLVQIENELETLIKEGLLKKDAELLETEKDWEKLVDIMTDFMIDSEHKDDFLEAIFELNSLRRTQDRILERLKSKKNLPSKL